MRYPSYTQLAIALLASAMTLMIVPACFAAPPHGYRLIWHDEFNQGVGKQPSPKYWTLETGNNNGNNGEREIYVNDRQHSHIVRDPAATDGMALEMDTTNTNGYQSVRMNTSGKFEFQYGYIEARLRIPYGHGIWPAFWMLGSNIGQVGWPRCGEIDIMENIGNQEWLGRIASTLHSPNAGGQDFAHQVKYNLPAGQAFHDRYHLFAALWEPGVISFYVDGRIIGRKTQAMVQGNPWPFDAPEYIILNTAVGGRWPGYPDATTHFPQKMMVDYVRVYQKAAK